MQKSKQVLKRRRLWNSPWELIILWHQVGSAQKKGALIQRTFSSRNPIHTYPAPCVKRVRKLNTALENLRVFSPTNAQKTAEWIPPEQVEFSGFARADEISSPPGLLFALGARWWEFIVFLPHAALERESTFCGSVSRSWSTRMGITPGKWVFGQIRADQL